MTAQMDRKDAVLSETGWTQEARCCVTPLRWSAWISTFTEAKQKGGCLGWGGGRGAGMLCCMEFQPEEMERFWRWREVKIRMLLTLIPPASLALHVKTLILMENDYSNLIRTDCSFKLHMTTHMPLRILGKDV